MDRFIDKCPKCGYMAEGKIKRDFTRNLTRGAVNKGSAMATGAVIGSVVPGIGTVVGGAVGLVAGTLMKDDVDKVSDTLESSTFESNEYEFCCPKCGKIWQRTQKSKLHSQHKRAIETNVNKALKMAQDGGNQAFKSVKDGLKKFKW